MKKLLVISFFLGVLFMIYNGWQSLHRTDKQHVIYQAGSTSQLLNDQSEYLQEKPSGWPWRGINVIPTAPDIKSLTEDQIREFAGMGINLIRLHMDIPKFAKINNISFEESIDSTIAISEQIIEWCEKYGIQILISSDHFPMNRKTDYNQAREEFWNSKKNLDDALKSMKMLVAHFDEFENVAGYSFISEPILRREGKRPVRPPEWFEFYKRVIATIREVSNKYILFTPGPGGLPGGYADMEKKFTDPKIIYNFHFFLPHIYTHQGIRGRDNSYTYPGRIGATYWDKDKMKDHINVVLDWAEKEDIEYLFAGSFSVVRWADGKDEYLFDLLSIFEENNISWSYHSFNGWPGWSYQHEMPLKFVNSRNVKQLEKSSTKTETQEILERFWSKNK